jgi:hypothetical protein
VLRGACTPQQTIKYMKNYRVLRTLGLFAACAGFFGMTAATPQGLSIDVTPAKFELSIPPGTPAYNIPITIRNGSGANVHIVSSMSDFGVTRNGDYAFQHAGVRPYSLMRWATINPSEFDLPTDSTQQVRLTLTVPKSSDLSGEYAGIVFFQTRPVRRAQQVSVSVRIATKIYATIPGTVKLDGAISKMTAAPSPEGRTYRVLFVNRGNAHEYVSGQLLVQKDNQVVERLKMPRDMLVERGGDRLIEVSGNRLPPGKYMAVAMIDYGGKTMTGGEIAFDAH